MDKTQALEKLELIGQQHLLKFFEELTNPEKKILLEQIESLNIPLFSIQQQMVKEPHREIGGWFEPFCDYLIRGSRKAQEVGEELIRKGHVGALIVAGGQGTRLKGNGPKGTLSVSIIKQKSLFQLFAEKTLAAGKLAGYQLPIAIMTSPGNHEQTVAFFEDHNFFQLEKSQVSFFLQGTLPLLNEEGSLFLDFKGHLAEGPDGNGGSLQHFYQSGIWDTWHSQGVHYVNFVLVDNPLADPFDAELVGWQHLGKTEVMIKSCNRRNGQEKVGVVIKEDSKVKVIEYSELPEEQKVALGVNGHLLHRCANLSLYSFSMDFIKKVRESELPLHLAHKVNPFVDERGDTTIPQKPNMWKFEKFIFDLLPYADKVQALLYPREECFAPLKNAEGEGSLRSVQEALQNRDREILSQISQVPSPDFPFELSQDFYYPDEKLLRSWKGVPLKSGGYITQ